MDNTKPLIPLIIISLTTLLASCNAYQHVTLNSHLPKSQYDDFFFEDDTIQVVYSFEGTDCPIQIDIFNKSDQTIYIDWKKCNIITGNSTTSLKPYAFYYSNDDYYEQIPSQSQLSINHLNLQHNFLDTQERDSVSNTQVELVDSSPINRRIKHFSQNNSPFKFKCHLSYSNSPQSELQHNVDHEFWVSSVFRTTSNMIKSTKDTYYTSKTTDMGYFLMGVGVVALVGAYVAIKVAELSISQE